MGVNRSSAWIALAAVGLSGSMALGAGQTQTVALTGDPAPGTATGVNFSEVFSSLMLNDAGQVVFRASLAGIGMDSSNNEGIWRGTPVSLSLVARKGTQAPGTPSGVNFSSFPFPWLNDVGQVAFRADLAGSGVDSSNSQGMWVGTPGNLGLMARRGNQAPGTPSGVGFTWIGYPRLNDAGQVAFLAGLAGSGLDSSNNEGIWQGGLGSLNLVARTGSQAPGTPSGVNFSRFEPPRINHEGQVAFWSSLTGGVNFTNNEGIFAGSAGNLGLVVRKGSPAPDTSLGAVFASFVTTSPALNSAGKVAFVAHLTGSGVDFSNIEGIWRGGPGSLSLVARRGEQAPGTPAGVSFLFFDDPVLNDTGQVAFRARLTGDGVTISNDDGIWVGGPGSLSLVARMGSQAPGTPSGVNYSFFFGSNPVLNDAGQVAFRVGLTGSGVNSSNNSGIWISDGTEGLLVIRKGEALAGRTISGLSLTAGLGALNKYAQLIYHATFTDGGSGVFLFTPDVRWRTSSGGSWDSAENWTLSIPPAHVHAVSVEPDVDLTVVGPSSDRVVRALTVGGGLGTARVELAAGVEFAVLEALRLKGNGTIVSPGVLTVGSVEVEPGGTVEIAGQMLVREQAMDAIAALSGSGLVAAEAGRALGYGPVAEGVLVKQTWGGDATLDGAVTIADLGVLAANWQGTDRFWFHGDFNGDGAVTIADLGILAGNWQAGAGGAGMSFVEALALFDAFDGVVVPEPGAMGVLLGMGIMGLRRRRGSGV